MQENEIDITNIQEKGLIEKVKDWSYKNWQTILITLIVLIVGVSVYNYNQQGKNTSNNSEFAASSSNKSEDNLKNNDSNGETSHDEQGKSNIESNVVNSDSEAEIEKADEKKAEDEDKKLAKNDKENKTETAVSSDSNASGKVYTITANYGEGITHLARHALEKYLKDTNSGSELTKEHKIYIEDYLQNRIGSQKLEIGDQETFSENLIQEAISNANKLSPKSLENLSKYTKNIK